MTDITLQRELSDADAADWQALCDAHTDYSSPLLGPHFARLIASVRTDVRYLLVREGGALVLSMAVHKRPFGLARPVGAPFSDLSGPVIAQGFTPDMADILHRAGIAAYRADAVPDPWQALQAGPDSENEPAWVISLGDRTPADYLEACRSANPKRLKNFRRLDRRLDETHGPIMLNHGPASPQSLAQLLAWKSRQFRADGLVDVVTATETRRILQAVARADGDGIEGYMVALMAEGQLYAGHFGVRSGGHFHPWISAYDPALSEFGPGVLLLLNIVTRMPEMELESYNIAGGHDHYKKYFALDQIHVKRLHLTAPGLAGMVQSAGYRSWDMIGGRNDASAAARLRRRLDHIATCERGLLKRASGLVYAVAKRSSGTSRKAGTAQS